MFIESSYSPYVWATIPVFFILLCFWLLYIRHSTWDHQEDATTSFSLQKPFILPGQISHTRLFPKYHTFMYPYLMVAVPVRSCPSNWLLSIDSAAKSWWSRGWLRVEPQDHLGRGDETSLSQKLNNFIQAQVRS
jgi:hypothetical protein